MTHHNELFEISQITNNIYLSGVFPLEDKVELIKKFKIKYILSCVDRESISPLHDKVMSENPDLTILYLPYNDDIDQNLWQIGNDKKVNILKYAHSTTDCDKLTRQLEIYNNKPMIEIGYHFINDAILSGKNILVHCMAGISRSVSLVTYYLMKKNYISYDKAFVLVKKKRTIANPNNSFKLQLHQYENKRDRFSNFDAENAISKSKTCY